MRNLTEANLTEAVLARIAPAAAPRFRALIAQLIRHLHGFVRAAELTPAEWQRGIRFLTDCARFCDDKRQEFILLSDILGVSMLVDAIANRAPAGVTESTVMGPFFRDNPPAVANGGDLSPGVPGPRCEIDARVLTAEGQPIAGAQIDVWQASSEGCYDSQIGDGAAHTMRGRLSSDGEGRFRFSVELPGAA
jgi:hydroxyquinol 1,2-dioxygenase